MKLKTYSLQIKKHIAVLLHIIFLTMVVAGISVMYLNGSVGSGLVRLLNRHYEDSPAFQAQFQADVDRVFRYVSYRDVFEEDGALDLYKEMFTVSRSGTGADKTYTLEEVIRYAQSQGFYLNDHFEVVNDLFIYDTSATTKDYLVKWRAYDINRIITEPGDAYASLLELSREVLDALGVYYSVHSQLIAHPTNFYFQIFYENEDVGAIQYSNAEDLSPEKLRAMGRYCYLDRNSTIMSSNLKTIPQNITVAMEQNNFYDAPDYYVVFAVDTGYPHEDAYANANMEYASLRRLFLESLVGLAIGLTGCLVTLYYLILVSGYRTEERTNPYLHGFDMLTTESCIVLTAILTAFALFLGEKIGYKLIHLLINEATWEYAERMMRALIIYTCCLCGGFSLLRRYKSRQLWENSMIHHLLGNISEYFTYRTYSYRLLCILGALVGIQVIGLLLIFILLPYRNQSAAIVAIIGVLILMMAIADYRIFHQMFSKAVQQDRVTDTIVRIAEGDTFYQMDVSDLSGKELEMGRMLNSIGTGLEQALQEKFRSERLKADLITNVSHDIKTPLTSIISYVDLIKRENIQNQKIQEYLNVLDQKSQRLKTLTEDLVEASKASSGNVKLEMTSIDLIEMIWQTNGEFEDKYALRHLELVSTVPGGPLIIEADGRHLWRVLENLYNNAFKYAMENSRVYVDVETREEYAYFTIKNVSENPLNIGGDELTERFVRGDVSRTTEGSGLGLSIAKSLTDLQGGTFKIMIDGDLFKVEIRFLIKEFAPEES